MRYNTNLFEQVANVPTPYIEVNQRSSENKSGDKGSIIVRFDWINHIKFMTKISDTYKNKFSTVLSSHFFQYLGSKSTDFGEINRLVNESLLQMRVTLSDTLGGSNASLVLENFDYRWTYMSKTIPDLYRNCVFSEGIYITIDAKGRFNSDRYYRIFAGTVNQISEIDNPTNRQITLSLSDYSRFLRYTRFAVHPALKDKDILARKSGVTPWDNKLADLTNIEIAETVIPNKSKTEWSYQDKVNLDFLDLWKTEKILLDWYTSSGVVDRNFMYSYSVNNSSYNSKDNTHQPVTLLWGDEKPKSGVKHQVYANLFKNFSLFITESKTRADILKESAVATFFSCYVDGAGNIHYHVPRYAYIGNKFPYVLGLWDEKTKSRENSNIFVLLEEESIDESYTQNEEDIVTRLWVNLESDYGILRAKGKVDPNLARLNILWWNGIDRYGLRERSVSTSAFENTSSARIFGLALFVRILLERKKMSTTMPMRAELQVDRPFYVPHKNMVYHIKSLTHTFVAGGERSAGTYTTTVDCFAGRPKEHGILLIPNLFGDVSFETIKETFKKNGYDIEIDALRREKTQEAKK